MKQWTTLDFCRTIADAWNSLKKSMLANAWKKLLDVNFVSENPEPVDDVRILLDQVQSESGETGSFSEAETMEWLQIDESLATWKELLDEQLIAIA